MHKNQTVFLAKSEVKAHDLEHKRKLAFNIRKYADTVVKGKQQFSDLEMARRIAKNKKWETIEHLDTYLLQFEEACTKNGTQVLWARDAAEALQQVLHICQERQATKVVKAKSMVTEEIHLNTFLEKHGIASVETDLGEYIQQLDGEAPYHIVTPAMHKSKEDVARLFHEKLGTEPHLTPPELTRIARKNLRQAYQDADVGITGGNFLLADIGAVCVTENEGNARLTTSLPKVHIAIVGIEKMLPSYKDLELFWPLLATYGTGQNVTVYNTIFTGPRQPKETDGPEEMFVILLDNGRTNMMLDKRVREGMYCIRCGSCLNVCPIYKNIGGHAYGATYSGPIGSVITPHLRSFEENKHLSYASSLCGSCTAACPVRINIHEMLLENRHIAVEKGVNGIKERLSWRLWKTGMHNKWMWKMGSADLKNRVMQNVFGNWSQRRSKIEFPKQNFKDLWAQHRNS